MQRKASEYVIDSMLTPLHHLLVIVDTSLDFWYLNTHLNTGFTIEGNARYKLLNFVNS